MKSKKALLKRESIQTPKPEDNMYVVFYEHDLLTEQADHAISGG